MDNRRTSERRATVWRLYFMNGDGEDWIDLENAAKVLGDVNDKQIPFTVYIEENEEACNAEGKQL